MAVDMNTEYIEVSSKKETDPDTAVKNNTTRVNETAPNNIVTQSADYVNEMKKSSR